MWNDSTNNESQNGERGMTEFEKKKGKKEKKRDLAAIGEQMNALVRAIPSLSHRL